MPKPQKPKINLGRCFVDWYEIDFGQRMYVCRSRDYSHLLGTVWGEAHYDDKRHTFFNVQGSHVIDWARRQGVRTLINKMILHHFLAITSPGATKEGRAFMRASGYVNDPLFGWRLDRPRKQK